MLIRTIRKGLEAFEFKFIEMQIHSKLEAFEFKFEPFEMDFENWKHSNSNSNHLKWIRSIEMQIRNFRKGFKAFKWKY